MNARVNFNPLQHLYGRQKLGQEAADECALVMLLSLDAAKRGAGTMHQSNQLCLYLLTALRIWGRTKKTGLHAEAVKGWHALVSACQRPTERLDLTTGEYMALRGALNRFINLLPQIELAIFTEALDAAYNHMDGIEASQKNRENT